MKKFTRILSCVVAVTVMCCCIVTAPASAKALSKPKISVSNTAKGVKISWKKIKNVKNYVVMRKAPKAKKYKKLKTVKLRSYIDKKVKSGKKYSYQVKAVKGNKKATSKSKSIVYLSTPKSVSAKIVNEVEDDDDLEDSYYIAVVKWKKVTGAKKYEVYRSKITGKSVGAYKKVANATSTTYYDYSSQSGSYYKYKVRAVKGSSKSGYSAETSKTGYMESPYINAEINSTYDGIKISWDVCTGATGYKVYKSTDKGKTFKPLKTPKTLKKTKDEYGDYNISYEDKDVTAGNVYVYYVTAYNSSLSSKKENSNKKRVLFNNYDLIMQVGDSKDNAELSQMYTLMKLMSAGSTEIKLYSEDESIVKVDVRGSDITGYTVNLKGISAGETFIDFKVTYSGIEASNERIKVKVSAEPVYDVTLKKGETDVIYQLDDVLNSISYYDNNEVIVTVTSNDTNIVKVNNPNSRNFTLTGVGAGETSVNVKIALVSLGIVQEGVNQSFTVLVTE